MKSHPSPKPRTPASKRARGRPSSYSEGLAARICEAIAGGSTLTEVCRTPGSPSIRTVQRWAEDNDEFCRALTRARVKRLEGLEDQLLDLGAEAVREARLWAESRGGSTIVQAYGLRCSNIRFLISQASEARRGDDASAPAQPDRLPAWFDQALRTAWCSAGEKAAGETSPSTNHLS